MELLAAPAQPQQEQTAMAMPIPNAPQVRQGLQEPHPYLPQVMNPVFNFSNEQPTIRDLLDKYIEGYRI